MLLDPMDVHKLIYLSLFVLWIVPLTTYIMLGSTPLPEKIQAKVIETGGEICTNVFFIGERGWFVEVNSQVQRR